MTNLIPHDMEKSCCQFFFSFILFLKCPLAPKVNSSVAKRKATVYKLGLVVKVTLLLKNPPMALLVYCSKTIDSEVMNNI